MKILKEMYKNLRVRYYIRKAKKYILNFENGVMKNGN